MYRHVVCCISFATIMKQTFLDRYIPEHTLLLQVLLNCPILDVLGHECMLAVCSDFCFSFQFIYHYHFLDHASSAMKLTHGPSPKTWVEEIE
jgi:hypothetical protein